LNTARIYHTATLLNNGTVVIAGGETGSAVYTNGGELFNPAGGTFTTTSSLNYARAFQTATLLNNGMVLVAGGYGPLGATYGSIVVAEFY